MVAAYHLVWTVYGYWLPNDPRGGMSSEIRNPLIAELGDIHFGRKKIQPAGRVLRRFHDAARQVLQHELLENNPRKDGFAPQIWPFVRKYDGWLPGQVRVVRRESSK